MTAGDRHAALPERPEQLGLLGGRRPAQHAVGRDDLQRAHVVDGPAEAAPEHPDPAAEVVGDHPDLGRGTVQRDLVQRRGQLVLGRGDERRLVGGHAAREQRLARFPVTLRVCREKVDACEPVDLQVDEARRSDSGSIRRAQTDAVDATVNHVDVAGNQIPVDECCPNAESHG